MKVCIQSKKWIKPATPTLPYLHNHQLSSIDQLQPPMFVQLILHFDKAQVQTTPEKQRIGDLEESLSKILTLYYPYAGRYNNVDELFVSCQDQGLEFIVATVDRKLAELADGDYHKEALVSGLDKVDLASDVACVPVLSAQVNVFSCGGIAIGLSFVHKVSDIFTFSAFMDAWATTCRLGTLDHHVVPPIFTISSLLPPKHSLKSPKSTELPPPPPPEELSNMQPPPRLVTKRFVFTKEAILKLKSSVVAESNTTNYTRVQLLTALITRCLVKIESAKGAEPRPFVMFNTMNIRSRVTLPIEENSCGNLYTVFTVRGVENESWELHQLADLIRISLVDAASDIGNVVKDWGEIGKNVEKKYMEFYQESGKGKDDVNMMTFSSWCNFPLNDIDFGWGKPSLVTTLPSPFAITHLIDCTSAVDEGGIEAWVCLKEDEMACFQNKPDILEYALSIPTFENEKS